MLLKELLAPKMVKERYRSSDIAKILNKKRQTVSLTLNRDINCITVKTLRQYVSAIGLELDLSKVINPS